MANGLIPQHLPIDCVMLMQIQLVRVFGYMVDVIVIGVGGVRCVTCG